MSDATDVYIHCLTENVCLKMLNHLKNKKTKRNVLAMHINCVALFIKLSKNIAS